MTYKNMQTLGDGEVLENTLFTTNPDTCHCNLLGQLLFKLREMVVG